MAPAAVFSGIAREGFNLSAWALAHRTLVLFFILAVGVAGVQAYLGLGRAEDPPFTFKVMTIRTEWPGASAREVERFVTDRIEKKLEEVPWYDFARSYSKPGESVIFLNLRDGTPPSAVPESWYQARKKVRDMEGTLPDGVRGPFFDDEFGDVYSMIYAFSGDDFEPRSLKKVAEEVRARLLRVKGVGKVDLLGTQEERVWVEVSGRRLAAFGLPVKAITDALARDNAVVAAGEVDLASDRVFVRVDVGLDGAAASGSGVPDVATLIRAVPIEQGGRQLTVGDVAEVRRGYVDPKAYTMRVRGQDGRSRDAIGVGVVMAPGGNVLELGRVLEAAMAAFDRELPLGVTVQKVADQPMVVEHSVGEFVKSLGEALAIVMIVSFVTLGWRTGIVVSLTVPIVLAATFVVMQMIGIDLHRISLGALIIALGLLVDDAIIAVEMMVVKLEQGWDRLHAGAFAWTSTAMPMLSGTIVTAAGFVPVGFAQSTVAEYTGAIFWVVAVALMISWLVAVLFTPFLGYALLPAPRPRAHGAAAHDVYGSRPYRIWRRVIEAAVRRRWVTIGVTAAAFAAALVGFGLVQQQFFPSASRPELLVDLRLPEGGSFAATESVAKRLESLLEGDADVADITTYVGGGSPRFYLPLDQQLQQASFAQAVVTATGLETRERLKRRIEDLAETRLPEARLRVSRLENGPPVGYPVQFRVIGAEPGTIRAIASQVREVMRADARTVDVNLDWDHMSKRVRLQVDLTKAQALGVAKGDIAQALDLMLTGLPVTQYREGSELIDVTLRTPEADRLDIARLGDLPVATTKGGFVPLSQVALPVFDLEEGILWRRGRQTTMTVRADVVDGIQAPEVSQSLDAALAGVRAGLPDGYRIEMGGAIEESAKGSAAIGTMMPLMLLVMVTVLMLQLQNFARVALVLMTAPLGLIGVTAALLLFGLPYGFVATLGVIALAGIIMRNSIILVDQIDQDIRAGHAPFDAVIDATVRRTRPILLTAAAAILAMIPLTRSAFWGPMAVAIMGGLAAATVLTLVFLPALYAAFFRVREERPEPLQAPATADPRPALVPAE